MLLVLKKYSYQILLFIILAVHALGLNCDIFNGDSALYASIAKNMDQSGDWLILNSIMQENWIDKPHLAFWIWAVFIKIFGNTSFSFKLPSFIALLILLRYLFLFTKKFYGDITAWTAVLILSSSFHIMIATNDVRLDIFLISFMLAAIYHLQKYWEDIRISQMLIGILFSALAVMTKGIYVLIPIGLSFIIPFISERNYRNLVYCHWLLALVLLLIGISPALYALKIQFDHFDNSLILGQKASNFLQFFFWDSQFGRFHSNLGQVQSHGDPSFYLHTLLWAFAPWSFFIFLTFFIKKNPLKEYISITCLSVMLVVISISKTQLPHHSLILLPFLSMIAAVIFRATFWRWQGRLSIAFIFLIFFSILIASFYLTDILFGALVPSKIVIALIPVVILTLWSYYHVVQRVFILFIAIAIYTGLYLNLLFYPEILKYQSGRNASNFVSKLDNTESVEEFYVNISLLNFYSSAPIRNTKIHNMEALLNKKNQLLVTNDYGLDFLKMSKVNYIILEEFLDYRTTVLKMGFINKKTRESTCDKHYLIRINPY